MIFGITGSRHGATDMQRNALAALLQGYPTHLSTLHHGDCVGVDELAHDTARALGMVVVVHPPTDTRLSLGTKESACVAVQPPHPYLDRNRDIVDACDVLIAIPRVGSRGTMYTIDYARSQGKPVWVLEDSTPVEIA